MFEIVSDCPGCEGLAQAEVTGSWPQSGAYTNFTPQPPTSFGAVESQPPRPLRTQWARNPGHRSPNALVGSNVAFGQVMTKEEWPVVGVIAGILGLVWWASR